MNPYMEFTHKTDLAYSAMCRPLCRELKLTQTAFDILLFLANNPGHDTASDIVELRRIKANLVSVNVNRLVEEGYLRRESIPGDRRKTRLICTDKALPIIDRGRALQAQFIDRLLSGMSDEQRQAFGDAVGVIDRNLDQLLQEGSRYDDAFNRARHVFRRHGRWPRHRLRGHERRRRYQPHSHHLSAHGPVYGGRHRALV